MIDTRIEYPPWYGTTRHEVVHVLIHHNIRLKYIRFILPFMLYLLSNPSIMKEEVFLTQHENITKWRLPVDHVIEWSADVVLKHSISK